MAVWTFFSEILWIKQWSLTFENLLIIRMEGNFIHFKNHFLVILVLEVVLSNHNSNVMLSLKTKTVSCCQNMGFWKKCSSTSMLKHSMLSNLKKSLQECCITSHLNEEQNLFWVQICRWLLRPESELSMEKLHRVCMFHFWCTGWRVVGRKGCAVFHTEHSASCHKWVCLHQDCALIWDDSVASSPSFAFWQLLLNRVKASPHGKCAGPRG